MPGNPNYDALLSTTLANYRKKFIDNMSKSFLLFYWLTSKERKLHEDGGESIVVPLMYGDNETVKSYDGYEEIDTTPQEGMTSAKYPWKQVAGSVSISRKEERQNSGEARIIKLLDSKIKQTEITFKKKLNKQFFGDGTGNGSRDMFGLDLLVENGTAWGTLGGIDRSDATNAWWRNQWIGAIGSFAANGLTNMRKIYNLCSRGNEHPDIGITTRDIHEAYEASQVGQQRFADGDVANAGFELMKFKGMLIGFDEECPSGAMFFLNSAYMQDTVDQETDMITTDFVRPSNQDAKSAQMLLMGNLVPSNCSVQGRLDGITVP